MILRTGFYIALVFGVMTLCVAALMCFIRFRFLGIEYLIYPGGITCWFIWGDGTHPSWAGWLATAISTGFNATTGFVIGIVIGGIARLWLLITQHSRKVEKVV